MHLLSLPLALMLAVPLAAAADETPAPAVQAYKNAALEEALKKLKLPGIEINLKERSVDVASVICLDSGALELIACTKDTKEHESIVAIEALPKHVHAALLLLGARPGSPAMRRPIDKEGTRWIDVPPSGGPVDVFLVFPDKEGKMVVRSISDFLIPTDEDDGYGSGEVKETDPKEKFPTHTFLFAGSILDKEGEGPPKYLSDLSGNVISIATFGDEVLCLSGVYDDANGHLMWQVDGTDLPPVGTKVTLRLRPQVATKPSAPDARKAPEKIPVQK